MSGRIHGVGPNLHGDVPTWALHLEVAADIGRQVHLCLCLTHPGHLLDPHRTPALAPRALEAARPPSALTRVILQHTALSAAAAPGLDPSPRLHLGVQQLQEIQRTDQTLHQAPKVCR